MLTFIEKQLVIKPVRSCHQVNWVCRHLRVLFALLLLYSFCEESMAQDTKTIEKITNAMQEAINIGRNADEPYMCELEGKKITYKEVTRFFESWQHDEYCFGGIYFKDKKLKDNTHVTSFSFLPFAEYEELVYSKLPFNDAPFSSLSQRGKGFVYNEVGSYKFDLHVGDIVTGSGPEEDIRWSGKVDENGNIDGEGVGFVRLGRFYWTGFKGKFKQGFPEGEVVYCAFSGNAFNDDHKLNNYTLQVGGFDGEWASLSVQGSRKISSDIPYEVNPNGRIIQSREYTKKKEEVAKEKKAKQLFKNRHIIDGCDFTNPDIHAIAQKLEYVLNNTKASPEDLENAALILAEYMINGSFKDPSHVRLLLKTYPEIANAKDVSVTWDDSKKVNIKDTFFDYLYNSSYRERVMYFFHDVYNEWGTLTEDEIFDTECYFVLTYKYPQYFSKEYKMFFPNGRYADKEFYTAWAQAYVDNSKRMLEKNDPKMWIDRIDFSKADISFFDWLHYPRLSRNHYGYSESTQLSTILGALQKAPKSMLFNNRVLSFLENMFSQTTYVFKHDYNSDYPYPSGRFEQLGKGGVFDEAKKYRSILDAIGAAAQIDKNVGVALKATNYGPNMVRWIAYHEILNMFADGLNAANELSGTKPEIRPACSKFKDFIKEKVRFLKTEVFDKYDETYENLIRQAIDNHIAEKLKDEKLLQEVENLGLPRFEFLDKEWQESYNDDLLSNKIRFNDITGNITDDYVNTVEIWRARDGSYYETVGGAFIRIKYKTEKDAIIASYAYLKYGLIRQKGRL